MDVFNDEYFMRRAIIEAQRAEELGEVPVGAVIVSNKQIIARGHNLTEQLKDFTAHAEMQAFTSASIFFGNKYLEDCTLYVTLEPCVMCAGAAFWTRISKIVFGAYDGKRAYSVHSKTILHPKTKIVGGILEEECSALIRGFFKAKRNM
jgi:tRNA(adenine34) deaminase